MKRLLIALLLTAACLAQPQMQLKFGVEAGHRYTMWHTDGQLLDIISDWPKDYVYRLDANTIILALPDELPFIPELYWRVDNEILITEPMAVPEAGPQHG